MLKLKPFFLFLSLFLLVNKVQAQYLWYENETDTENILYLKNGNGVFSTNETNPAQNGLNTNAKVSKFVRDSTSTKGFSYFQLYHPIRTAQNITVNLKAYIDLPTEEISGITRLRIFFKNTVTKHVLFKNLSFTAGQEWQDFSTEIEAADFNAESLANGGYDQMYIGYGNGQAADSKITYYIDQINGSILQEEQYLWYENETETENILFSKEELGTFHESELNPDNSGNNTNSTTSKFVRNASVTRGFVYFNLSTPIETATAYKISLKGYMDVVNEEFPTSPRRLRAYFKNTTTGDFIYKQKTFTSAEEWQDFNFIFKATDFKSNGLGSGGYDLMYIGFGNGQLSSSETTYYIDQIYGTTKQTPPSSAEFLAGSWGITFPVFGGERLDSEVLKGMDHRSGAQEVVDNLTNVGHIITNLSYFAHSHYFTIRQNANVDIVNEIHESLVPSIENEQIIFDVMQKFKDSGKKIILYISTNYLDRADEETHEAWVNYYTNNFGGNEYLAYRHLVEGYIKIVKDYTDGYWLDTTAELDDDGNIEDFVQMIRNTDPGAAISAQPNGTYFQNEEGGNLLVDSDSVEDEDERDYKIIDFNGVNSYQDYTSGHVTPLGQGAPPNSWAYDEFSLPAIAENPWATYEDKTILKHAWFPMRNKWHVSTADLMFGTEDAYRFTRIITEANAGITFATTVSGSSNKGHIPAEEMAIMKEINDRLSMVTIPDYEPYVRPLGAFLVGEDKMFPWYENEEETATDYITIESILDGVFVEKFTNPSQTGINLSDNVTKITRDRNKSTLVYFNLPNSITDLTELKISLDVYINASTLSEINSKVGIHLSNTDLNTSIYNELMVSAGRVWENLEFDFSNEGTYADGYNQLAIEFANGNTSDARIKYFIDNLKGSINQYVMETTASKALVKSSTSLIPTDEAVTEQDDSPLKIYPNPVTNSFKLSKEFNSVSIYSITGKKLLEFSGSQSDFDVSKLNTGFYIIKTYDDEGKSEVLRFIKK